MSELFQRYEPVRSNDAPVAAAKVAPENVKALSQITGGVAIWKKIRGGSMRLDGITLHGFEARVGDYIIADRYDTYIGWPGVFFETKFKLRGDLPPTERR